MYLVRRLMAVASPRTENLNSFRVSSFAVEGIASSNFNRKLRLKDSLAKGLWRFSSDGRHVRCAVSCRVTAPDLMSRLLCPN